MPSKYHMYRQISEQAARQITGSYQNWTGFLETAARLYKYPYHEQLMIYAQRPDATACAEYDFWNGRMHRYVRRGAKGIALIDTTGDNPCLRYVFDISDTGTRENARPVWFWRYNKQYADAVSASLENAFDVSGENGLRAQFEGIAARLASEYWQEHQRDILDIIEDSFLEGYDDYNIEVAFRNAAAVSITYSLMFRCGLEPQKFFEHEDFLNIFDFSTSETVSALGTAVSEINQQVLRQIETTIRNVERARSAERMENHDRTDLQPERRLSDSRPEPDRADTDAPGQVRQNAEGLPEGASPGAVEQPDPVREVVLPFEGDRRDGESKTGADHAGADEEERRDGDAESPRSDGVDGADEQPESAGGGADLERAGVQLIQDEGGQLSLFLSEEEQIERIDLAESFEEKPFAFSFADEDIDTFLRFGSNTDNARLRIVAEFSKEKPTADKAAFLRQIYHGGYGLNTDSGKLAVWYAEDGIYLSQGASARYQSGAQVLSWEDASGHIDAMLAEGRFATNVELAEAAGFERVLLAQSLWYLRHDLSDEAREAGYLPSMVALIGGGFPDETQRLSEALADPSFRRALTAEYEQFLADYSADRSILRFHYHKVDTILSGLKELELPRREYSSELAEHGAHTPFITEDEIDAAISRGSGFAGGKQRIYDYFFESHSTRERAEFLKKEYGTGGRSHALSGATHSNEDHASRGERFRKAGCAPVELTWQNVAKRIDTLIRQGRYFNPEEQAKHDAIREAHEEPELQTQPESAVPEQSNAEAEIPAETGTPAHVSERRIEDADIEEALRAWNGRLESKQAVVRYMEDHGRGRGTAAWLSVEYGGISDEPLHISIAGTDLETTLSWPQVQRHLAQMIQKDRYFTDDEKLRISEQEAAEWLAVERAKLPPLEYAPGDHFIIFGPDGNSTTEFVLTEVTEDDVYYTFPDAPDDEPVSLSREEFDRNLRSGHIREALPEPVQEAVQENFSYHVGDTVYLEDGKPFVIESIGMFDIQLRDPSLAYPIFRAESRESFGRLMELYPQQGQEPEYTVKTIAEYPVEENNLPYDIVVQTIRTTEPDPPAQNFRITDDHLGEGGPKAKFRANMDAINTLKTIELESRSATPEEQEILSRYVGWGGLADAFDEGKTGWASEYQELFNALSPEEYAAARASTLNAHYTSPTVIRAIYEAVSRMGFTSGNILEPSMGVGNFFGMLPQEMSASRLYGVELDSITGRIAKQLYPQADITVAGFETIDRKDFYDLAVGNVPFGQYQVNDRAYNKLGFSIHNYFFAKALDQVRPGGVVAFVSSRYTMDAKDSTARRYLAQRAEFLGAIRLPNNAFRANAGTDVVSDIIFLQKRDHPIETEPDWVHLNLTDDGFAINSYFVEHPEMMLGRPSSESTQYGHDDFTLDPIEGLELSDQLEGAIKYIRGTYTEAELPELGEDEQIDTSIPADPNVKNYSYTIVEGEVYFRENSRMVKPELNATATERVKGLVALRDCVNRLIDQQMDAITPDGAIQRTQAELNELYDSFSEKYGLINSRANSLAFADDSSYYLLCSLEVLNEDGELERKADMFTKRTIKPHSVVTSVDTASEALALSISEKAGVDMAYMSELTGKTEEELADELRGVIFRVPAPLNENGGPVYQTSDEYLSGNVREKLRIAQRAAASSPETFNYNVEALQAAQPKDLDASEIDVRLGATWISKDYIQQFMEETFHVPFYLTRGIRVNYSEFTAEWNIQGKNQCSYSDVNAYVTYGTQRANAYKILEDTLNLRDVRIYDTIQDPDGKERRILNSKETTLAQQKQQVIKDAFRDWIWNDPDRRRDLVRQYNELFNATRPREYGGSHIRFSGINPEITLREHQLNAVAHILYGGNTLLAHEVGAGKTFEMVAAAMESKRLGLCQKSLFVVPNHLTEQWASEFLRLYPSASILVAAKKDFETRNRKKFCARIATGDYDAVIIGHSQFERIPVSQERQERMMEEQIEEIREGIAELKASRAENFTIKQMEKTRKSLEARLRKLQDTDRKDDVITFEQLGVDRLFVDEAHNYKNLFLYTKMRNVAGLSTTDAQKSSDMLLKCRYIDEITDSRGVVFATGTPVSNSMTELYTMMRYLQHDTIQRKGLSHFDAWASTFGETTTAIELAPEGTGYRARTRFAKFFNLPELMNLFKEAADIKTADQLNLPTPTPVYHNVVAQPTEVQKEMVQQLSERAAKVHAGIVDPSKDNMLKITSDGRKLGLDQRVINPDLPDDPTSKVNLCVDNIVKIYRDGDADKLTQLVFCDLSTPKGRSSSEKAASKAGGTINGTEIHALEAAMDKDQPAEEPEFTIYEDIREKLVSRGIPRDQIAFIHDANTEVRKKELFAKVRTGQVRVLMGSTFKMGAGMNVQDRLIALHDLDAPWRPGDLEQRSGRIIRQGNRNPEVHIFRYVTEATFDAYLWQTLENKQKFVSQIMTSKSPVRSCEDIDEAALSYAEIKALCAGDERIKEKMDLDIDVARLKLMKANHQSQQYRLEDNLLKTFPEQIDRCKGYIAGFEADLKTLAEHPHPKDGFAGMTVRGDVLTDKENAGAALLDAMKEAKGLEPVPVGSYRGFQMSLTLENFGKDYILTLKGETTHRVELGKDAKGNLVRIDNALSGIQNRLDSTRAQLENTYAQVESAKAELGKPFPQEAELQAKSARLTELNIALNIDERAPMEQLAEGAEAVAIAKSERPSVLEWLNRPLAGRQDTRSKPKTREEELS